jgi:hypothetical protein
VAGFASGFDQTSPDRVADQLETLMQAEFLQHVGTVPFDRLDADLLGDVLATATRFRYRARRFVEPLGGEIYA